MEPIIFVGIVEIPPALFKGTKHGTGKKHTAAAGWVSRKCRQTNRFERIDPQSRVLNYFL